MMARRHAAARAACLALLAVLSLASINASASSENACDGPPTKSSPPNTTAWACTAEGGEQASRLPAGLLCSARCTQGSGDIRARCADGRWSKPEGGCKPDGSKAAASVSTAALATIRPSSYDRCGGVVCTSPNPCKVSAGCQTATGTCAPFKNMPDGTLCPTGTCRSGTCVDMCAGVTCPSPRRACQRAGVCLQQTGQCGKGSNAPNGTFCGTRKVCVNGMCRSDKLFPVCYGNPANIANGVFACGATTAAGSQCTAKCDYGYAGSPTATCTAEGRWSTVAGECLEMSATAWSELYGFYPYYLEYQQPGEQCREQSRFLSAFALQTQWAWPFHIRFIYSCSSARTAGDEAYFTTTPAPDNGDTRDFQYHDLRCPDGSAMTQWHLYMDWWWWTFNFEFWCAPAGLNAATCESLATPYNEAAYGHLAYMDRHYVICPWGKLLTQWALRMNPSNPESEYRIEYTCCA